MASTLLMSSSMAAIFLGAPSRYVLGSWAKLETQGWFLLMVLAWKVVLQVMNDQRNRC